MPAIRCLLESDESGAMASTVIVGTSSTMTQCDGGVFVGRAEGGGERGLHLVGSLRGGHGDTGGDEHAGGGDADRDERRVDARGVGDLLLPARPSPLRAAATALAAGWAAAATGGGEGDGGDGLGESGGGGLGDGGEGEGGGGDGDGGGSEGEGGGSEGEGGGEGGGGKGLGGGGNGGGGDVDLHPANRKKR